MAYWRPTGRARERIMVVGGISSGKTSGALDIAARALGPDDTMWVLDRDNTWDRFTDVGKGAELGVREEYRDGVRDSEFEDPEGKLVIYHVTSWPQVEKALAEMWKRAGRNDWIVVDDVTWLWQDIQNWYYLEVHGGEGLPEFLLNHRKRQVTEKLKETQGQDAQLIEWNYVNPLWNRVIATPFVNPPCHLYVCASAKELRTDGRVKAEVTDAFGPFGYAPNTQWRLAGQMQTVLMLDRARKGTGMVHRVSTVKDRQREFLDREEWTDLFMYLRKVAGWRVARDAGQPRMRSVQ